MEKIPVTFNYLKGNAAFLLILVGQMYCCERDVNFHPLVHGHSQQLEAFHIYLIVMKIKLFTMKSLNLIIYEDYNILFTINCIPRQ